MDRNLQLGEHARGPEHPVAVIRPWHDPLVDERGHDPRSSYAEKYWLGVIGPTASWIMRRFADEFDDAPDGFTIDLAHTASSMGLSYLRGAQSPFGKALHRCVMFGLAHATDDGWAVRRRVPSVARRHLSRLPDDLRDAHEAWARAAARADRREIEQQLVDAGIPPAIAARAGEAFALAS